MDGKYNDYYLNILLLKRKTEMIFPVSLLDILGALLRGGCSEYMGMMTGGIKRECSPKLL